MKINGVTVFQETLTMNSSLCELPAAKPAHTHHPCVIRRLRTELKSLRHSSSATEHNERRPHKKGGKQNEAAKKAILSVTQCERDHDEDDFIPFIVAYRHFCISSLAFDPCHGTYQIRIRSCASCVAVSVRRT